MHIEMLVLFKKKLVSRGIINLHAKREKSQHTLQRGCEPEQYLTMKIQAEFWFLVP